MLSTKFLSYIRNVAPVIRFDGLKKFHVQHAMSLATGDVTIDHENSTINRSDNFSGEEVKTKSEKT